MVKKFGDATGQKGGSDVYGFLSGGTYKGEFFYCFFPAAVFFAQIALHDFVQLSAAARKE